MHLIGRHDQIRCWVTHENRVSPPFALDRGRAQDRPSMKPLMKHPEWEQHFEQTNAWLKRQPLTQQICRLFRNEQGIIGFNELSAIKLWFGAPTGTPSVLTRALNAVYTAGSAGPALAGRIFTSTSRTLSFVYCYIFSYSGTAALVLSLQDEVRAEAASILPNTSTAIHTGTVSLSSQTGWIKCSTANASLTAMTPYWIIVGGNTSGGVNFANVVSRGTNTYETDLANYGTQSAFRTTDGWVASRTLEGGTNRIIGCFSDGTAVGDPFTADTTPTNDANDKGLYLNGLTAPLSIVSMASDVNIANSTGIKVYAAATNQGGATLASGTTIGSVSSGAVAQGYWFSAPYTIPTNTPLRLVFYGSGNFNGPRKKQIGTIGIGSATDLQGAFPLGGSAYFTVWNGSAWADDQTGFPVLYVWIQDQVASAASSTIFVQSGGGGMAGSYYA